jgi:hypothetical protein
MSSYYPSFSYTAPNGKKYNSYKDKHLIVVHFESGDDGEMDTFLGMEPIYTDNAYGTRRLDYGAKYKDVAVIRISVMKADGTDFTVAEVRDFLRWTTGSRNISYLDLSDIVQTNSGQEEVVAASFLGRITAVYQQKLDARTIGFVIEHTSVSPYAYSQIIHISKPFAQVLQTVDDGVLVQEGLDLTVDDNFYVSDSNGDRFDVMDDGVVYVDNSIRLTINNDTDDLSSYVYLDTIFTNQTSDHLIIKNQTIYEESDGHDGITELTGMYKEVITLSSGQFIMSSKGRSLGNSFNFVWPKLMPGENNIIISGSGEGQIEFTYRYPIKIGDCAMDVDTFGSTLCGCGGSSSGGSTDGVVTWGDIIGKPSTIKGYGITDAYTIPEVDSKISDLDVSVDKDELDAMLEDVLE